MASLILVRQPKCEWCEKEGCKADTLHTVTNSPFAIEHWDNTTKHQAFHYDDYGDEYQTFYRWPR